MNYNVALITTVQQSDSAIHSFSGFIFIATSQLLENSREVFSEEWCKCLHFSRYVLFLHVLLESLLTERMCLQKEPALISLIIYSQRVDVMVLPQCVSDTVGLCWGFQADVLQTSSWGLTVLFFISFSSFRVGFRVYLIWNLSKEKKIVPTAYHPLRITDF